MTTWMDIAFSPAVKAVQERRGSRQAYARMEAKGTSRTEIDTELAHFISEARSFYLATASRDGQPYIQHRGGPPGFLRVLDPRTLAFADFKGNRQYISTGNLADNPRAMIFIMNYETQQRVKIWGTAEVVEGDEALIETLMPGQLRGACRGGAIGLHGRFLGHELSSAHSPDGVCRGCRNACRTRHRARSGKRAFTRSARRTRRRR